MTKTQFIVFDNNWKEKYRISHTGSGCWDTCVTSNRTGTRFAVLDMGQSWGARVRNTLDVVANDVYTDKKVIRVFTSQDGKKLFEYSWMVDQSCQPVTDGTERVAFSDDGEMLAVLGDDAKLRVFRILDER